MIQLLICLVALVLAFAACERSQPSTNDSPPAAAQPGAKVVKVTVADSGFNPSSITLAKGDRATLEFTRTSNATCADKVVFPDLGITKDLPLNKPVAVDVPTGNARKLTFQCGMGMYQSAVVVR